MPSTAGDVTDPTIPMATGNSQGGGRSAPLRQRESWHRHLDYMLTMVGYSVGLSNLLRFPYICNKNGGGKRDIPPDYTFALLYMSLLNSS